MDFRVSLPLARWRTMVWVFLSCQEIKSLSFTSSQVKMIGSSLVLSKYPANSQNFCLLLLEESLLDSSNPVFFGVEIIQLLFWNLFVRFVSNWALVIRGLDLVPAGVHESVSDGLNLSTVLSFSVRFYLFLLIFIGFYFFLLVFIVFICFYSFLFVSLFN